MTGIPVAEAHHDGPYCSYGANVLPDFVRVEAYRLGQGCPGPKVTVLVPGGSQLVLTYTGDEETDGANRASPDSSTPEPRKKTKRCGKAKRRRCRSRR